MESRNNFILKTKANLKKRIFAAIIDYGLVFLFIGLMLILFGQLNEEGAIEIKGWPAFFCILFWFSITIIIEQIIGATIGNRLQNLKVVSKIKPQNKLTFIQSLKRHLLDSFDLFFLIAIITIKNTEYHQRLGDIWAQTVVLDEKDPEQRISFQ